MPAFEYHGRLARLALEILPDERLDFSCPGLGIRIEEHLGRVAAHDHAIAEPLLLLVLELAGSETFHELYTVMLVVEIDSQAPVVGHASRIVPD